MDVHLVWCFRYKEAFMAAGKGTCKRAIIALMLGTFSFLTENSVCIPRLGYRMPGSKLLKRSTKVTAIASEY